MSGIPEEVVFLTVVVGAIIVALLWFRSKGRAGTSASSTSSSRSSSSFAVIPDQYNSIEQVQIALRRAGLESSNLVVAVDYTQSNRYTGEKSFGGKCLHDIRPGTLNPYQRVISIMGRTLARFDDDNLIPAYGFGDSTTKGKSCFSFTTDPSGCHGFEGVLQRYNELTPHISLRGPTNFAPVIRRAIQLVQETKEFHILLIVADGQVTAEEDTRSAIVEASKHALSIVCIGVGDGPWDVMEEFDDGLPSRDFDNWQFVPFERVMSLATGDTAAQEALFAMHALMEIPAQFQWLRRQGRIH